MRSYLVPIQAAFLLFCDPPDQLRSRFLCEWNIFCRRKGHIAKAFAAVGGIIISGSGIKRDLRPPGHLHIRAQVSHQIPVIPGCEIFVYVAVDTGQGPDPYGIRAKGCQNGDGVVGSCVTVNDKWSLFHIFLPYPTRVPQ